MIPQHRDDLLFREPLRLLRPSPLRGRTLNLAGGNLQGQVTGDAITGGTFVANGAECKVPQYIITEKFNAFAEKCPPNKFLNAEFPECSCASFNANFNDFAVVMVKSGGTYFSGFGSGGMYPYLVFCLVVVSMTIAAAPFVYFFSYRMSRNEIRDTHKPDFFLKWHRQRLSSLICLVLICFGFSLFFFNLVGSGTTFKLGSLVITTAYPGLVLALFGILVWMKILNKSESVSAHKRRNQSPS